MITLIFDPQMWHRNDVDSIAESTLAEEEREQERLQALLEVAALRQQETAGRLADMSLRLAASIRRVRRRELLQAMFALRLGVAASRVLRSRARAMLTLFRAKARRLLMRGLSRLVAATNRNYIERLGRLRGRVFLRIVWHLWNRPGVDKRLGIAHFAVRLARRATKSAWAIWLRSLTRLHRIQIYCQRLFSLARRVWTTLAFETWARLTHRLSGIRDQIAKLANSVTCRVLRTAFRCMCSFMTRARFIERLAKRASSRQIRTAFAQWLYSTRWLLAASHIGHRFSRRQLGAALLKWKLQAKLITKAKMTLDNAMKHIYMQAWSHQTSCARWLRRRSLTSALHMLSAHVYSRRAWRRAAEARHIVVTRRALSALRRYATFSRRLTEKRERLRLEQLEIEARIGASVTDAQLASAVASGAAASAESVAKYSALAATSALHERASLALLMATEATASASIAVIRLKTGCSSPVFAVLERVALLCFRAGRRLALRRAWVLFRRSSKTVAACIALHAIFRARDTTKKKAALLRLARRRPLSAIQAWLSLQRARLVARAFTRLAIVATERRTPRRLVVWASRRRSLKRALEHWRRMSAQNLLAIVRSVVVRARRLAFARWRSAAVTSKARLAALSKHERANRRRSQALCLAAWRAKIAVARADSQKRHSDQRRRLAERACALKSLFSRPPGRALVASTRAAFFAWRLTVFSFKLHLLSLENAHLVSRLARLLQLQTDLSAQMRDVIY